MVHRKHGVSLGDGEQRELIKAIRMHANSIEYIPIGIILLAMAELQGAAGWLLHLGGLMLLSGPVAARLRSWQHPAGRACTRINGMYLTFGMIALMALTNIAYAVF